MQELSLGDIVSPDGEPGLPDCPVDLQHLAHLKTVAQLDFCRPLPKNIGILKNLAKIGFETDDKVVDLGVLQVCGQNLKDVRVRGWRTFERGNITIEGLAKLHLDGFSFEGGTGAYTDVAVVLDAGLVSMKDFLISCEGRLSFRGKNESFDQLWCGLEVFHLSYFSRLPHQSDFEVSSGIQTMLAAAKEQGVHMKEHKKPCTHPALGLGSHVMYNKLFRIAS